MYKYLFSCEFLPHGFGLGLLGCRVGVQQRCMPARHMQKTVQRDNTCSALMRQCRWQQTINFHQLNLKG